MPIRKVFLLKNATADQWQQIQQQIVSQVMANPLFSSSQQQQQLLPHQQYLVQPPQPAKFTLTISLFHSLQQKQQQQSAQSVSAQQQQNQQQIVNEMYRLEEVDTYCNTQRQFYVWPLDRTVIECADLVSSSSAASSASSPLQQAPQDPMYELLTDKLKRYAHRQTTVLQGDMYESQNGGIGGANGEFILRMGTVSTANVKRGYFVEVESKSATYNFGMPNSGSASASNSSTISQQQQLHLDAMFREMIRLVLSPVVNASQQQKNETKPMLLYVQHVDPAACVSSSYVRNCMYHYVHLLKQHAQNAPMSMPSAQVKK